jgi:drug/metabolite transporter (DMT)-like permease
MVMDTPRERTSFPVAPRQVSRARPASRDLATRPRNLVRDRWRTGVAWAIGSVALYASMAPIAKLAYADGGDPLTLLVLRSALIIIVVGAAARIMPFSLELPPGTRLRSFLLGLLVAGGSGGILSSVMFIPVGPAVLIYYVFPLLVLFATSASSGARISVGEGVCAVLAFAGLIVALAPGRESIDGRGVLLAAGAALSVAGMFLLSRSLMKDLGSSTILFWSNVFCGVAVVLLVLLLGNGDILPLASATSLGWIEMTSISMMFLLAMIAQLAAIRSVGPRHTAAMFNLEPVLAMGFAMLLLGERITATQLLGSVMVVGALGAFGFVARKANH